MRNITIDQKILIERMLEAAYGVGPVDYDALHNDVKVAWSAAADAAVRYLFECLGGAASGHTLTEARHPQRKVN